MRSGLFVHYVFGGNKEYPYGVLGKKANGSRVTSVDELADSLDVEDIAAVASSMHAEYLQFTAWHADMNVLYPSAVIAQQLPSHSSTRDVIRDLINALRPTGIKLILYVHPCDGHDFSLEDQARVGWHDGPPYTRWNAFINAVFQELVTRYRGEVAGYWFDGGLPPQVAATIGTLRETIRAADPHAETIQNESFSGLLPLWADYRSRETHQHQDFAAADPLLADPLQVTRTITANWWAEGNTLAFPPEVAFQYTVLQAAVQGAAGGGVVWCAGPYPGGQWEPGVKEFFQTFGLYIAPVASTVLGTKPSRSFVTEAGTPLTQNPLVVATESADGTTTCVHVLHPPAERKLHLPVPQDGRIFYAARLFKNDHPVTLTQDERGVHLTLPASDEWDALDTVITLQA